MEQQKVNLLLTGLNHKTAPVSLREKISFPPETLPKAFRMIREQAFIRETLILSTCNRTEIYVVSENSETKKMIPQCLSQFHDIPTIEFFDHLYVKEDLEAARHLLWVTGGLDSLVLGENQILGQVKQFYKIAQEQKSLGILLHRLFQSAIEAGKRVRHETALGDNPSSVGEAAVNLAKQIFGDLKEKVVLILGAGEMGKEIIEALVESGVTRFEVCSKTYEKAKTLAEKFRGTAYPMEALDYCLGRANIVISALDTKTIFLTRKKMEPIMKARKNVSLFLIDIAVPRNIEESVGQLSSLYLYNIDDLAKIVEKANFLLQKEMGKAKEILEEELLKFLAWQESREVIPTIKALTNKFEEIKSEEMKKMLSRVPNLNENQKQALEHLADRLIHKLLHQPLVQLKKHSTQSIGLDYAEVVRELFGLET